MPWIGSVLREQIQLTLTMGRWWKTHLTLYLPELIRSECWKADHAQRVKHQLKQPTWVKFIFLSDSWQNFFFFFINYQTSTHWPGILIIHWKTPNNNLAIVVLIHTNLKAETWILSVCLKKILWKNFSPRLVWVLSPSLMFYSEQLWQIIQTRSGWCSCGNLKHDLCCCFPFWNNTKKNKTLKTNKIDLLSVELSN